MTHLKYIHYFGNEASESLLNARGILTQTSMEEKKNKDMLRPKPGPNCFETNKSDSKFCAKCRMVLTYDAYNETLEKQQEKESEVQKIQEKYEQDMKAMRKEIMEDMKNQMAQLISRLKPEIVKEGLV
jgi:hypothetical protein